MQAQKTVQFVSVRFIALACALLIALLLASTAGYIIRGGTSSAGSTLAPPTLHFQQMTDNQMERAQARAEASPRLTSPYGVGH
jgi:hypothetical protein